MVNVLNRSFWNYNQILIYTHIKININVCVLFFSYEVCVLSRLFCVKVKLSVNFHMKGDSGKRDNKNKKKVLKNNKITLWTIYMNVQIKNGY